LRKLAFGVAVVTALASAPGAPAAAETSLSGAALTTVSAVAGAAAGVVLVPYLLPTAAPAVAGAYTVTATAVNNALVTLGNVVIAQPQVAGAVIGIGAGIIVGDYLFN
jgi:hypothetical protein